MDAVEMLRRQREARSQWHELDENPPRRAVLVRRPSATSMLQFASGVGAAQVPDLVTASVVGWRGFTEADLLGAAVASSDSEQPFDAAVFREWIEDDAGAMNSIAIAVVNLVQAHASRQEAAAKN